MLVDSDYLHVPLRCTMPSKQFLMNILPKRRNWNLPVTEDTKTRQQTDNRAILSKERIYPKTIKTMFKIESIITFSLFANNKVYWNGREMGYSQNV